MTSTFQQFCRYTEFGPEDWAEITRIAPLLRPHLEEVVRIFYQRIDENPETRAIMADEAQAERLRRHLYDWLSTMLTGPYDEAYAAQRARIGHAHVRVGLPQHYMVAAIEVIWAALVRRLRAEGCEDIASALASLHRLVSLELALMLEAYKEEYSARITELERAQLRDRLSRVEHLAETGQLAASLAHEIKNPLAGISGAIQIIRAGLEPEDERRRVILDEVLAHVRRVDGTVRDLLTYARPRPIEMRPTSLETVVARCVSLLRREPSFSSVTLSHRIQLPEKLVADANQLEQLLINLLLNAAQASPADSEVELRSFVVGQSLVLEVQDEGPGFSDEILARATDPFFTTKTRGTGLGLAIVKRIVETHHGTLQLDNARGGGLVRITIPLEPEGGDT